MQVSFDLETADHVMLSRCPQQIYQALLTEPARTTEENIFSLLKK
jgi:hypothetical protein